MPPFLAHAVGRKKELWSEGVLALTELFRVMSASLRVQPFLAPGSEPSICDVTAYCEVEQLKYIHDGGSPVVVFERDYPLIAAWMGRLSSLPHHDEIRGPMIDLFTAKL